ncbi:MAG: hypothetical protein LBN23_04360 [Paludibacter sp.]|jgi:predicted O-methyltransferase YrrM|nr:hypothetical protein [Paludibacter sp.]
MFANFFNFLRFIFSARHTLGFGVHSPFVYNFLRFTVYVGENYYIYNRVEQQRFNLNLRNELSARWGQALFRTVRQFNPENIVEIGAKRGISTAYLAANSSKSICLTLGKTDAKAAAEKLFKNLKLNNITYCETEKILFEKIEKLNKIDFLYIAEDIISMDNLTKNIFSKLSEKAIIVIKKPENGKLWKTLVNSTHITAAVDLFYLGIAFTNSDLQKKEYRAIY